MFFSVMQKLSKRVGFALAMGSGLLILCATVVTGTAAESHWRVYFGTYTGPKSQGIYVSRFDAATGRLGAPELAAEVNNPSFLAVDPSQRFLYAVGELNNFGGQRAGAVSAFRLEPGTGKLTLLNQEASGGTGPCHVSVDQGGKCVLVANYGSGSIAALPVLADGRLGAAGARIQHQGSSVNPQRQTGPHAHFIVPDPANQFALVCDLGLDKVLVYRLDPGKAALEPNQPPSATLKPGAGPRHLAFHPNRRWVYGINELNSTLTAFAWNATGGELKEFQTVSALPPDFKGENTCAEVQVHPSGKFLYGSNRGHDSLVVFSIEPDTGRLAYVEHQPCGGKGPRHFALDPSGRWLVVENQFSNNVVVFQVNAGTGRLKPTGQTLEMGAPVCAVFVPEKQP
jgi:6-phosphogluconolactonase